MHFLVLKTLWLRICSLFYRLIVIGMNRFFKGILGTRFGSLELLIGSLESEKIIIGSLESEKIGSLESEKTGPTDPYRVPNIFLKKALL